MRYWWVNQNQTFRQERAGRYLWSPKRNTNGARNPFYEFMREVAPGDLVLSFEGTFIRTVGVIQSYCYESPKPSEFGAAGPNWDRIGWKVDVYYRDLVHQIRPADHMQLIQPRLPTQYSPLQASGRGLQGVYLTSVTPELMDTLADLIGSELRQLMQGLVASQEIALDQWGQTNGDRPHRKNRVVIALPEFSTACLSTVFKVARCWKHGPMKCRRHASPQASLRSRSARTHHPAREQSSGLLLR
jgi:hypothetical protein